MKNSILRYGTYSSLTLAILFTIGMIISEVFGYASMIISLLFVFIGIKHLEIKKIMDLFHLVKHC